MNKPTQSVEAFKQDEHEALTFHKLKEPVPTAYVHEPEQWAMNFIEEMLQHTPAHSLLASQVFHELQRQLKDRHTTQHATQESYDVIAGLTEYLEGDPYPPAQTAPVQEPITDTEQINRGCWYKTNLTTPPAAQPAPVQHGTFPEGYALHELPADYTGKLWIEGQVRYLHQLTAAQPAQQEPVAWVPALYPGHYLRLTKPPESWKMIALYTAPQHQWTNLIRGVRVYGDKVVITVKGGNEAARSLCEQLLREKEQQDAT